MCTRSQKPGSRVIAIFPAYMPFPGASEALRAHQLSGDAGRICGIVDWLLFNPPWLVDYHPTMIRLAAYLN